MKKEEQKTWHKMKDEINFWNDEHLLKKAVCSISSVF